MYDGHANSAKIRNLHDKKMHIETCFPAERKYSVCVLNGRLQAHPKSPAIRTHHKSYLIYKNRNIPPACKCPLNTETEFAKDVHGNAGHQLLTACFVTGQSAC